MNLKYFEPIYLAGQNEKIHSYKCNFTVDILIIQIKVINKDIKFKNLLNVIFISMKIVYGLINKN